MPGEDTAAVTMAQKQPISPEMATLCNSLVKGSTPCNYCEIEGVGYHVSTSGPERDEIVADFEKNVQGTLSYEDFAAKWAHARVQD